MIYYWLIDLLVQEEIKEGGEGNECCVYERNGRDGSPGTSGEGTRGQNQGLN